jgi:DNA-binding NarL/FixJ family response regulator
MTAAAPLRVAVLSPYALVRAGLTELIRAAGGRAVVATRPRGPDEVDVVVYDLAALTAGESSSDLEALLGHVPVVGLARLGCPDLAAGARALGVRAVVHHDVDTPGLLAELERAVGRGQPRRLSDRAVLTDRERRVLSLIGAGLSNQEITEQLAIGPNSVKTYIRIAYRKIGVSSRSQAVLWTTRHGLARSMDRSVGR